jgi:hypothetical protein
MKVNRRGFATSLTGAVGALLTGASSAAAAQSRPQPPAIGAASRLSPAIVTKIRLFYPPELRSGTALRPFRRATLSFLKSTHSAASCSAVGAP